MINLPITRLSGLKLDNKKILLIAAACLIIFYMDFKYAIKLQLNGIRILAPKAAQLKKNMDALAKDLSRFQDLERTGMTKQQIARTGLKEIVQEDKILVLLQEVSDLANKNGVRTLQINTARDTRIKEEVIAGEKLLPVIINLNLSCDYHSLGRFTGSLDNTKYFIEIDNMKITRDDSDYLLQNVNLILKTYARK